MLKENMAQKNKKSIILEHLNELVKKNIQSGIDRLPSERELADEFGVSRNILREALGFLTARGIIEIRERQGIFIKNFDMNKNFGNVQNIQMMPTDLIAYQMELRIIISVPAAELAAFRRTDEDIAKLWECYDNFIRCPYSTMEEKIQNGKWEGLLHYLVTEAAHNPILSRVNESINSLMEKNTDLTHPYILSEVGWMEHIQTQHYKIIKALEKQNSKEAGEIMKIHLIESFDQMQKTYPMPIPDIPNEYWKFK